MDWKTWVSVGVGVLAIVISGFLGWKSMNKVINAYRKQNYDLFAALFIYSTLYGGLTDEQLEESARRVNKHGAEIFLRQLESSGLLGDTVSEDNKQE